MNPEVALESFCDERYSLVVAQLEERDLFGDLHLNTGSFFVRNDEWGRRILEAVDGTAQEDSPCWEQKAFVDLFTTQSWVRQRVRVEMESWRFNAFLPTYRKGDFVFHALGPIRTLEGKIDLIRRVMAEDHQIDFPNDPPLPGSAGSWRQGREGGGAGACLPGALAWRGATGGMGAAGRGGGSGPSGSVSVAGDGAARSGAARGFTRRVALFSALEEASHDRSGQG